MQNNGGVRAAPSEKLTNDYRLADGSRVAVIGSGPAGSFFAYFLLDMAQRVGTDLQVDLYENKDFSRKAPHGCNMCGGVVSESLVQILATEGINLPGEVVQRGIDSYVLHMDDGTVRIDTPLYEKRIGTVHRGPGPRDLKMPGWASFDGHLQSLAVQKGARPVQTRVVEVSPDHGRPQLKTKDKATQTYDLLAVATGVNAGSLKLFEHWDFGYRPPGTTKTYIQECRLDEGTLSNVIGNSMHVFLLDIPRLDFAAIIPKGEYVTVCLLGEGIDDSLTKAFLESPDVKRCLAGKWRLDQRSCHCSPRINVRGAARPFSDRIVFIGDCAVTRLYKDGIGAAYKTAKAAAKTAVFHDVSAESFKRYYHPVCKAIALDNAFGKVSFAVARRLQRRSFARRAILRMTAREQQTTGASPRMSSVLWDMFTGSASYKEIFARAMWPSFWGRLLWHLAVSLLNKKAGRPQEKSQ